MYGGLTFVSFVNTSAKMKQISLKFGTNLKMITLLVNAPSDQTVGRIFKKLGDI